MNARCVAVVLGGLSLVVPAAVKAECRRGANCLGGRDQHREWSVEPAPALPGQRYWDGWQLLVADGLAFGMLAMARAADVRGASAWAMVLPAVLTYKLVPPIIHWRHDRGSIGWASLGLRDGIPGVAAFTGALLSDCPEEADGTLEDSCFDRAVLIGLYGGMVVASVLDAWLLARDAPIAAKPRAMHWAPVVSVQPGGAALGLTGTF